MNKRALLLVSILIHVLLMSSAEAATPQPGWWWNTSEPGRGYFIEVTGGAFYTGSFLYDNNGNPIWFATGPGQTTSSGFSGGLGTYSGGQSLTGSYKAPTGPTSAGQASFSFSDASHGTIAWPGGTVPIVRYEINPADHSLSQPANTFQPETGWWWNEAEGGRGFSIEVQGNNMFIAGFMYRADGNPVWYVSAGTMTTPQVYQGTWIEYADGQAMGGVFKPAAIKNPNVGAVSVVFSSTTTAMLTLPDGRQIPLKRYSFSPSAPITLPQAGNPSGTYPVPAEAEAEDVSSPDHWVGTGTAASCTADAFIQAVALGGRIRFNCGTSPLTITLARPAKVFNNKPDIVIDGGGLITLSGGSTTRILYMNTCDQNQVWTTSHCQDQDHPHLTVQNITFSNGNSTRETQYDGGGAIWVRGGRLKVVNSRFINNTCASTGPDVGGAAIRVFSQYQGLPVYVVRSTFGGGAGYGNSCANGGGISSIGVSWSIYNSLFSHNRAVGNGGNPASAGTPGGGSGGAIYNDGNYMKLALYGTLVENNEVSAYGSAIFFVTNDHSGVIHIENSTLRNNTGGSWYPLPGVSMHSDTEQEIINSVLQ